MSIWIIIGVIILAVLSLIIGIKKSKWHTYRKGNIKIHTTLTDKENEEDKTFDDFFSTKDSSVKKDH